MAINIEFSTANSRASENKHILLVDIQSSIEKTRNIHAWLRENTTVYIDIQRVDILDKYIAFADGIYRDRYGHTNWSIYRWGEWMEFHILLNRL